MRTRIIVSLATVITVTIIGGPPRLSAQTAPTSASSSLSADEHLLAENHLLRVRVADLEAKLAESTTTIRSIVLREERARLVEAFRKTLKPDLDAEFDWTTLTFIRKADPPKSAPVEKKPDAKP